MRNDVNLQCTRLHLEYARRFRPTKAYTNIHRSPVDRFYLYALSFIHIRHSYIT